MPLTHDIGVRIPYPLLKTDNFGCLFFFVYLSVICRADDYIVCCFVLIIVTSKLDDINPKTQTFGSRSAYHTRQNIL